jgi:hypothetical protein
LAQERVESLALWMSDQLCPLLPYVGAHPCWTASDQYLVGMAGWIFAGTLLLLLMGISETIESRKAERSSVGSSVPELEITAPALQSPRVLDVMAVGRAPTRRRVRRMKRRRRHIVPESRPLQPMGVEVAAGDRN